MIARNDQSRCACCDRRRLSFSAWQFRVTS
jgi:hypothetical protein